MFDLESIVEESYKEVSSRPSKLGDYGFVALLLYVKRKSKKFKTIMTEHGYDVTYNYRGTYHGKSENYYRIRFPRKYWFRVPDVRERQLYELVTKKLSENGYNVYCEWKDD